jgi:hypothetical protein
MNPIEYVDANEISVMEYEKMGPVFLDVVEDLITGVVGVV